MASISVGWAWPSQTHLIGWDINAGLESSAGLNSWAYVSAYARKRAQNCTLVSMNCSAYARVYAHTRARSMNPALSWWQLSHRRHNDNLRQWQQFSHYDNSQVWVWSYSQIPIGRFDDIKYRCWIIAFPMVQFLFTPVEYYTEHNTLYYWLPSLLMPVMSGDSPGSSQPRRVHDLHVNTYGECQLSHFQGPFSVSCSE